MLDGPVEACERPSAVHAADARVHSCRIRIDKEDIKFSAGHFTLFADGTRERLHGHNFSVSATVLTRVGDHGMAFDYNVLKSALRALCRELDEYVLLPGLSSHLTITAVDGSIDIRVGGEQFLVPASDVKVLPIRNTTVEELASYLLERLMSEHAWESDYQVGEIELGVSSGPGQSAHCVWLATP